MSESMNRDLAIDVTRGLAIWSMITAHFADGAKIAMPTHAFPFVDGMSVFVLLSGFVLGLVHRRWIERNGLVFAFRKLAARLVVLYLCQLTLALIAVAAGLAGYQRLTWLRPVSGWPEGIRVAATMAYLPSGSNILLLYMVLMASAFALFPLLHHRAWPLVLVASIALYLVAQIHSPDWFYLTAESGGPRIQNWAAWQMMFVPALVIGWQWQTWRLGERIERRLPLVIVAAGAVALIGHYAIDTGPWTATDTLLADKLDFGVARVVGAWVLVPAVYGIFRVFLRLWHRDWLRPLLLAGTRSLDSYVIQAAALIVIPVFILDRPWSLVTMSVIAVGVFLTCWAWAEVRRACGIDKLHRLPAIVAASTSRVAAEIARSSAAQRRRITPADTVATPEPAPEARRRMAAGAHS